MKARCAAFLDLYSVDCRDLRPEGCYHTGLFSPRLWTENGLLTQAGSETFWDRSTLYALRGVYSCGETEKATDYLKFYSVNVC